MSTWQRRPSRQLLIFNLRTLTSHDSISHSATHRIWRYRHGGHRSLFELLPLHGGGRDRMAALAWTFGGMDRERAESRFPARVGLVRLSEASQVRGRSRYCSDTRES